MVEMSAERKDELIKTAILETISARVGELMYSLAYMRNQGNTVVGDWTVESVCKTCAMDARDYAVLLVGSDDILSVVECSVSADAESEEIDDEDLSALALKWIMAGGPPSS